MATLYAYNNQLWKEIHKYTYTGGPETFTLQPGEYLLQCHGASGGGHLNDNEATYGGSSYGILNLTHQQKMHAYVGGNGTHSGSGPYEPGYGGWNGGGNGGTSTRTKYYTNCGAGGGGGTDIRLSHPGDFIPPEKWYVPDIPDEYGQVGYLISDGNQYFDTGYIAKENSTFVFSAQYADQNHEFAILGTEKTSSDGPGWIVWFAAPDSKPRLANLYGTAYSDGAYYIRTTIWANQRATIRVDKYGSFINGEPASYYSSPPGDAYGPEPDRTMLFLTARRGDDPTIGNRMFAGRVYFLRIYEMNNGEYECVHEFIPCVRKADAVPGLYDTIGRQFITALKSSSSAADIQYGGDADGSMGPRELTKRNNYPTIPEGYKQLEYIRSTGSQYFATNYVASRDADTIISVRASSSSKNSDIAMFGSQSGVNTDPGWIGWLYWYSPSSGFTAASIYGTMTWSSGDYQWWLYTTGTNTPMLIQWKRTGLNLNGRDYSNQDPDGTPDTRPIYIFNCIRGSSFLSRNFAGKLYHFNIFEKENDVYVVKHSFIPCIRESDNAVGLLDVAVEPAEFLTPIGSGLVAGPEGAFPIVEHDPNKGTVNYVNPMTNEAKTASLLTRIMVAGGGGGTSANAAYGGSMSYAPSASIGGGVIGAPMKGNEGSSTYANKYASQTEGGAFGKGLKPATVNDDYSCGGSGGGWYGGYACESTNGTFEGGGGSGYVLTETSYKPEGYNVPSTLYMTQPYMESGTSKDAWISVAQRVSVPEAGDTIVFPCIGDVQQFDFEAGVYVLKCWGGCGGYGRYREHGGCGGYAEGKLFLRSPNKFFVHVGGSGVYGSMYASLTDTITARPSFRYNGGGAPSAYGSIDTGEAGGGASDIRIGNDSLYSRVIVAGGGGGHATATYSYIGGAGGGLSGVEGGSNNTGYANPGTQTGTGHSSSVAIVNGGFGYGGNSYNKNSGASGGGWYGGSSAVPTGSYYGGTVSGSGGSGYVLTDTSYKPVDYLLGDEFHLVETKLVQGGNNLPYGQTKIEIDVVSSISYRFLCRDADGIKRYDDVEQSWVVIPDAELTESLFEEYGSIIIDDDNGLQNDYEILVYDPNETATHLNVNVTPSKQEVVNRRVASMSIRRSYIDLKYNKDDYDVETSVRKRIRDGQVTYETKITIDKLNPNATTLPKIYFASYMNR